MMIIPRENKYVRLYIQVSEVTEDGQPVCVVLFCSRMTFANLLTSSTVP